MVRGETLLIALITGIFGYVSQKNITKNLVCKEDIYFKQLRHHQDNTPQFLLIAVWAFVSLEL